MSSENTSRLPATAAAPVRLLSWNVHGTFFRGARKRLPLVAAVVAEQRPDFIAFQEVWTSFQASMFRRVLEPLGYASIRYTRGYWRRGGLLLMWDTSKGWSVTDSSFVRFEREAPWWRLAELDGMARKGFLVANARHTDGRAMRIVVTHLQAQYPDAGRLYDDIRLAQLHQLATAIDGGTGPLIVAGDINTVPGERSGGFEWLLARGWRDATAEFREAAGAPRGTFFDTGSETATTWLDFIFIRGDAVRVDGLELIHNRGADDPYSDHDALVCSLRIAAQ